MMYYTYVCIKVVIEEASADNNQIFNICKRNVVGLRQSNMPNASTDGNHVWNMS